MKNQKKKQAKRRKARILRVKRLAKKYGKWIVSRYVWTGKPYWEFSYYDEFTNGWANLWHMLIDEINVEIHKHPKLVNEFYFLQVKEKYGEIRAYTCNSTNEIERIIDKYSHISRHVCAYCGKPDTAMTNTGWIYPACKDCYEKHMRCSKPYEEVADIENAKCPDYFEVNRHYPDGHNEVIRYDIKETADRYRTKWERRCKRHGDAIHDTLPQVQSP